MTRVPHAALSSLPTWERQAATTASGCASGGRSSAGRGAGPLPTSGLDCQVRRDTLGADDVDSLALVLALVVQGDARDPKGP